MLIYLSGGIQGYGFDKANTWRDHAVELIKKWDENHKALNPLRNRMWKEAKDQKQFNINELAHRDLLDVEKCDAVLVEMTDPYRNYVGTVSEIVIARSLGKPIVAFVGEDRLTDDNGKRYSYWLDFWCTAVVATLEDAVDYICSTLDYGEFE